MVPDSCPYRRPFSDDFADCPGYEPELYLPTSLRQAPLPPVWTCCHLTIGAIKGELGHLYARCLIGDAAARREALLRKLRGPRAA
ncbi:MAG: hypothetical protein E6I84_03400 [Chloroflexi bacterium]|nr:MAG: hypothetical protein E6I84_03400 [Chloroflexota bacterium]